MDPTAAPKQTNLPATGFDSSSGLSNWPYVYDVCCFGECEDSDMIIANVDLDAACGIVAALNARSVSQDAIDGHLPEFRSVADVTAKGWVAMASVVIRRRLIVDPAAH